MFNVLFTGLFTGLALIVAIGAQNAFVLRQGIRGERVLPIVLTCLLSDLVAITAGVAGLGVVIERWPAALPVAQVIGGLYLIAFGIHAALRAWRPTGLEAGDGTQMSVKTAVLTALALTWLNPHFYLDAIVLLGTVANSFGADRWWFLAGALIASTCWFFALGYGSRLLRGLFAKPSSWRILDGGIAVVMGALGVSLLAH
ncbi:LysE/ArgO family amino acid transporter [Nocardioides daphniae]|uniref:Transporter n=1 Tax=Nocardioides daphniae TaxID=402297 RepID=A0A4V1CWC1_9ACTN|nr:LysE/ArgO family amino acid transporter [Nocardioides daphniae]QCC76747.1 amino acid transporter [Nocardioides daphniae]GGD15973.1 putative transporter [Nocardioides daphniae]